MKIEVPNNGPIWPVDPKFNPISAFGPDGQPAALSLDADGNLKVSGPGESTIADGADEALGAKGDAAASDDTGAFSLIALVKRGLGHLYTMLKLSFGLEGATYITGTSEVTGTFGIIHALEDTVIDTMTSSTITGTLEDIPLATGDKIYGSITSITLTSGKVIAYNA